VVVLPKDRLGVVHSDPELHTLEIRAPNLVRHTKQPPADLDVAQSDPERAVKAASAPALQVDDVKVVSIKQPSIRDRPATLLRDVAEADTQAGGLTDRDRDPFVFVLHEAALDLSISDHVVSSP
jgi:hypothetical protein